MTTQILPPERWAMNPGAHAGIVSAYADRIGRVGYDAYTFNCLVASARHLCAWAHLSGRTLVGMADGLVQEFAGHDCQCGGVRRGGPRSARYLFQVERFVRFLVSDGVLTAVPTDDPDARHVVPYLDWLRRHRGLSEITVRSHAEGLRQLLPVIGSDPAGWTPTTLRTAILDRRGREGRGGLKRTVTRCGKGRCVRLHRKVLQHGQKTLDHWLSQPGRVRKEGRVSLTACPRNPQQANVVAEHLMPGLEEFEVDHDELAELLGEQWSTSPC